MYKFQNNLQDILSEYYTTYNQIHLKKKKTRTVFTIVFQYLDSALAQRQSVQFDSVKTWNKLPTNLQESTCAIQEMLQNLYFYCRLKLLLILLQLFYYLCFKRIMFMIIYLHLWNKLLSIPAKGVSAIYKPLALIETSCHF